MKDKILSYCASLGLNKIGFVKCRKFNELREFFNYRNDKGLNCEFEEFDIEKRINPNIYMKDGKTIITIAFPYLYNKEYNNNGFSIYTRTLDYHKVVKSYLEKICCEIHNLGGEALPLVDSNALPERYIAYLGGLGTIGKNNMLITKEYGSYVFLGEIITNLEIETSEKGLENLLNFEECGECEICFSNCPTKSINKNNKNCNICLSYITQKKNLTDIELRLIKDRVFGCDTCQICCPLNKDITLSNIDEFKPLEFMEDIEPEWIMNMSNREFKESFKKTSCGWRGKNVIKRNVAINIIKKGQNINRSSQYGDYVQSYIDRLLK